MVRNGETFATLTMAGDTPVADFTDTPPKGATSYYRVEVQGRRRPIRRFPGHEAERNHGRPVQPDLLQLRSQLLPLSAPPHGLDRHRRVEDLALHGRIEREPGVGSARMARATSMPWITVPKAA